MAAIRQERRAIEELKPAEYNPRKRLQPGDEEYERLKRSIETFGYVDPIIINADGTVIGGHQRLFVLQDLEYTEADVAVVDLSKADEKALNVALNKISGEWDDEKLAALFADLTLEDYDLTMTGFSEDEYKELSSALAESLQAELLGDPDEVPEPPKEPVTLLGDIWQIGRHRLMCGSSTDKESVLKLTANNPICLIYTDPPYGMNAVSNSGVLSKNYTTDIMGDDDNSVAISAFMLASEMYRNTKQIWWGANYYTECLPSSECWIVWDKNNGASDQTDCELAWSNFRSVVRQFTMASEKKNRVHPTQKPVKLFEEIVMKFDKNDSFKAVLDLFGGSGATLVACELLGRICYVMELDPKFCDVIVNRYASVTGKRDITLIRNGKEIPVEDTGILN